MQAYAPSHVDVVLDPAFESSSFHWLNYMKRAKNCLENAYDDWKHIKKYFVINSYPCHPENILYCSLISPKSSQDEREHALQIILDARARQINSTSIRKFILPTEQQINWDANSPMELLKWDKINITPPPLLEDFSDQQLTDFVFSNVKLDVPKLTSHQQHNERAVKATSKEVAHNVGIQAQKGNIIVTDNSRKDLPITSSKKNFSVNRKLEFD